MMGAASLEFIPRLFLDQSRFHSDFNDLPVFMPKHRISFTIK